jgi:homoaconitase/3-isopropylmalate dehydratase large subunit
MTTKNVIIKTCKLHGITEHYHHKTSVVYKNSTFKYRDDCIKCKKKKSKYWRELKKLTSDPNIPHDKNYHIKVHSLKQRIKYYTDINENKRVRSKAIEYNKSHPKDKTYNKNKYQIQKERYHKDPKIRKRRTEININWQKKNWDKIQEYHKEYYKNNPDKYHKSKK